MSLTLVVLAAGSARRYGALKQLVPVGPCGEALLEFAAFDALRAGFDQVVLVIRPENEEAFLSRFDRGLGRAMSLGLAFQTLEHGGAPERPARESSSRTRPWGTGHAVLSARQRVRGPFAVVNADDFYGRGAYLAMARRLESLGAECGTAPGVVRGAVTGYRVDQTLSPQGPVSRALLHGDPAGRLRQVQEFPSVERDGGVIAIRGVDGEPGVVSADALVSMNMWGFEASVFEPLSRSFQAFVEGSDADDEFLLPAFVNDEIAADRLAVDVLPTDGPWTGMTFESDREKTERFLAERTSRGEYPSPLWSVDPERSS